MFNHLAYNQQFLAAPGQNDAKAYGVTITPAQVQPGQQYWRIIGIHHLTGPENMGNHHVYADVLDEAGNRIQGAEIRIINNGQSAGYAKIDKPANEAGANIPMWSNDLLNLHVSGALSGDWANGFRSTHPDEEIGNTWGHHSFYVVWQRTTAGEEPGPDPDPDPTPPPDWRNFFTEWERGLIRRYERSRADTPEVKLIQKFIRMLDGSN